MSGEESNDGSPLDPRDGRGPRSDGIPTNPLDRGDTDSDSGPIAGAEPTTVPPAQPRRGNDHRRSMRQRILHPVFAVILFNRLRPKGDVEFEHLVTEYGYVRAYYRVRAEKHRDLQRWLNQASFGVNFDVYLARAATYAMVLSIVGVLLGIGATYALVDLGVVSGLTNPFSIQGSITQYLGRNRMVFVTAIMTALSSGLISGLTWYGFYYYPRWVVDRRRRNINVSLPHAIVYMYALSQGGRDLIDIFASLADSEGIYGEIADEFEYVIRDVEVFGNDLQAALQNTRDLTPSENLKQFLDDMLSVIESGADVTTFLEEESDRYLDDARTEQESFLETLSLLSEVFIVVFVAAPLFFVVMLLVMSLLGADTLVMVAALVYVFLPLGVVGFLLLIDMLNAPFVQQEVTLSEGLETDRYASISLRMMVDAAVGVAQKRYEAWREIEAATEAEIRARYERQRKIHAVRNALADPTSHFREQPIHTLLLTVPLAAVLIGLLFQSGVVNGATIANDPIRSTIWLAVLPGLVVLVPLSYFIERQTRRERQISQSFPDMLNVLSSANRMGVSMPDAMGYVSRWAGGTLGDELRYLRQDIEWNNAPRMAFIRFANRMSVSSLSRAMKLVSEGLHSTPDLSKVLRVAADDARTRAKLLRQRRDQLSTYVVIVLISFGVYLLVILMLNIGYLEPIAEVSAGSAGEAADLPGLPIAVTNLPVQEYKLLFFHSGLIQALGSGLLAGKLSTNRSLTGLKYSVVMIILATVMFTLL